MTNRMLQWMSIQTGRRRFIQRTLSALFGVFAGLTVGQLYVAAGACGGCHGPYGSGYCGDSLCNGYRCSSNGIYSCTLDTSFCSTGTGCWSTSYCGSGGVCCDCDCSNPTSFFYCYCFGYIQFAPAAG